MAKEATSTFNRLYRSQSDRMLGGVAGGLGEYFGIDATLIRLIFIFLTIFGGSGVIIYILLWILVPVQSDAAEASNPKVIKERTRRFAHELRGVMNNNNNKAVWGLLIIIFGLLLLFSNLGLFDFVNFNRLWPLLLIVLGIVVLTKK
ncbi:MAG: PspC domain-containing protein [Patescibacteria group bacterium]|nr:PspC domain-containing protein [Patescibacteria group bacterium]